MKIDIDELTEQELVALSQQIVNRLRTLDQNRIYSDMMRFGVGQRVSFEPGDRPLVTGILTKHNKKTVTVVSDDGQRWNVSPGLLQEAKPREVVPNRSNIISLKARD